MDVTVFPRQLFTKASRYGPPAVVGKFLVDLKSFFSLSGRKQTQKTQFCLKTWGEIWAENYIASTVPS